jgi:hypothetical protein
MKDFFIQHTPFVGSKSNQRCLWDPALGTLEFKPDHSDCRGYLAPRIDVCLQNRYMIYTLAQLKLLSATAETCQQECPYPTVLIVCPGCWGEGRAEDPSPNKVPLLMKDHLSTVYGLYRRPYFFRILE